MILSIKKSFAVNYFTANSKLISAILINHPLNVFSVAI